MFLEKPKLLFSAAVERRPYFRRFMWLLLGAIAALAATIALGIAADRSVISGDMSMLGQVVGILATVVLAARALFHLLRWLSLRTERLQFFDKGFIWERKGQKHKYSYAQVKTFREGVRSFYIFDKPIYQRGAHTLVMRDGKTFRISARHGDTRRFARAVRRYIAEIHGQRMAQALREGKRVRIHNQLAIDSDGIIIGKKRIPWREADVRLKNNKLLIARLDKKGHFRPVKRFDTRKLDNWGGFIEVAMSVIRNHQPERFNIRTAPGYTVQP